MNLAMGIGTLLLAGWVLPTPDQPGANLPADRFSSPVEQPPGDRADAPQPRQPGGETLPPFRYGSGSQGRGNRLGPTEPYVPLAPTDPTLSNPNSPWLPPTENSSTAPPPSFGTPRPVQGGAPGRAVRRTPGMSSSAGRPSNRPVFRPANDLSAQQAQVARMGQAAARPNPMLSQNKPFTGYKAPPSTSPYMSLYQRTGTGVDNYTTFVKPQLEQAQSNQMFGGEIRGLQSAARLQGSAVQRLGKKETMGATNAPEFFMNHRQFYPAFNR